MFALYQVPFNGFANTGLTEGPGGPLYNDRYAVHIYNGEVLLDWNDNRQVFSYHLYCIIMDKNGEVGKQMMYNHCSTRYF